MAKPIRRLYRCQKDKVLGGVCSGIAEYFQIDLVIVRVLWVITTFFSMGLGLLAYFAAWIIIPEEPKGCHTREHK